MNALNEATRSNGVFKATLLHKDHNKMTIKLHQSAISLWLNGVKLPNMSSIFVIIQINCAKSEKKITNLSASVANLLPSTFTRNTISLILLWVQPTYHKFETVAADRLLLFVALLLCRNLTQTQPVGNQPSSSKRFTDMWWQPVCLHKLDGNYL